MVPPELEPFFLWLESWKMAGKTGQSLCWLCEETWLWLSGPSLSPSHLRSPGSRGECCVELWEHLGVDPETAMTLAPQTLQRARRHGPTSAGGPVPGGGNICAKRSRAALIGSRALKVINRVIKYLLSTYYVPGAILRRGKQQ